MLIPVSLQEQLVPGTLEFVIHTLVERRMDKAGVILTATNALIDELAQDWSRPEGGQLVQILFEEVLPPIQ